MEDSFKVRIDRTFGSLASSSQPLSSSLWSLTDEEIERKEWNRDPLDAAEEELVGPPPPFPSNIDGFFLEKGASEAVAVENPGGSMKVEDKRRLQLEDDLESLDEEEDDDDNDIDIDEGQKATGNGGSSNGSQISKDFEGDEDELEVKNSIGMDCTLDYEEEEDEYDKVAVGRVKSADRIYLGDFDDYGVRDVTISELPDNFGGASKDPRANHLAAQLRLKEDEETAAKNLSSLQVSSSETTAFNTTAGDRSNQSEEDGSHNLRTILKRKESEKDSSTEKRVRFAPGCKESESDENGNNGLLSTVPDYIRNPKGYTHYTIDDDSNDINDQSNRQACMDFLNVLRKSKQTEADEPPADLSLPVIFNPKRKTGDGSVAKTSNDRADMTGERFGSKRSLLPSGIVAENATQVEDGVCVMDEDTPQEMKPIMNRRRNKATRQYRSKANLDIDEPSS